MAARVRVCAECIYEEDYDLRAAAEMCERIAPALDAPATQFVSARAGRGFLGRRTILLTDTSGGTWRTLRGGSWRGDKALVRLREVEAELARTSLLEFWRRHQSALE